jgi:hypothetical protein
MGANRDGEWGRDGGWKEVMVERMEVVEGGERWKGWKRCKDDK